MCYYLCSQDLVMHIAWIFSNMIFSQSNLRKKQKKLKEKFLLKFYSCSDLFWAYLFYWFIYYLPYYMQQFLKYGQLFNRNFQTLKFYFFSILLIWVNLTMTIDWITNWHVKKQPFIARKTKVRSSFSILSIFRLLIF